MIALKLARDSHKFGHGISVAKPISQLDSEVKPVVQEAKQNA